MDKGKPPYSKCHEAIAARGAAAITPPGKNAKPWKPDTAGAIARNEILRTSKRVGRTIWRRWSRCHRRSRVETRMHRVKLPGQRLAARDCDRQVAEFQSRVAVPNGFTALGIPVTEARGQVCPGKAEIISEPELCNSATLAVNRSHRCRCRQPRRCCWPASRDWQHCAGAAAPLDPERLTFVGWSCGCPRRAFYGKPVPTFIRNALEWRA